MRSVPASLGFEARWVGPAVVVGGVIAWLWPIGFGGWMPIGGDVTQFFLGLMDFYRESLKEGRLPVWNDLWGYGFPGLAESQMGVFYPVHVILYRLVNTETAYVVSLVAHTIWGGLGAYWAARRVGTSRMGSTLSAFCWTTCGFFVVHLAHPWGYTTGCWMPWAWGLGFSLLYGRATTGAGYPFLLVLVLALQLLPGHFQLAFVTQCGLLLIVVWAAIERLAGRRRAGLGPEASGRFTVRSALVVLFAVAWAFPLAAIQLVPTARLAQLAGSQRGFGYLSDFASPPLHLVNYVAPGLFHRSPLWRPLVWDPFHAMPEEHLTYVGLVPLFLAWMTVVREWRRDVSVRLLAVLAGVTLFLSLGPYLPGFRSLIMVPGFNFFRAPSRWSLATALALALLAGKGFDCWTGWVRPGRSLSRLVVASFCWVGLTVGLIELALFSTGQPGWPDVARGFDKVFAALPWAREPSFATVLAQARRPLADARVGPGLSQTILVRKPAEERVFADQRTGIYVRELGESGALVILVLLAALMSERSWLAPQSVKRVFIVLTFLDLWILGRHRLIDLAPWKSLTQGSPVLERLAREPRGTRIADRRLRNLPMRAGLAPISAYRTLDLPVVVPLSALAMGSLSDPRIAVEVRAALRATGTGVRLIDPIENREDQVVRKVESDRETIEDPFLAVALFDSAWVAEQGPWTGRFSIWRPETPAARAWFVPKSEVQESALVDDWSGDPRHILRVVANAIPLSTESRKPEEWTILIEATTPGWVIVTQLADPQWKARWTNPEKSAPAPPQIRPVFRKGKESVGWQCIEVPEAGVWSLRLEYESIDVRTGFFVSAVACSLWLLAMLFAWFGARRPTVGSIREKDGGTT